MNQRRSYFRSMLRGLAFYGLTLLAVTTLVFALPRAMPGDPLAALEDPDNDMYISDPEVRAELMAYYGLDKSLPEQYLHYIWNLGRGDLGWSIARKVPVAVLVGAHLPWTLLLMALGIAFASVMPARIAFFDDKVFDGWYYTPGCSPCRATRNKHIFVTGSAK